MVKEFLLLSSPDEHPPIWVTQAYWDESNEVHPRHPDELG